MVKTTNQYWGIINDKGEEIIKPKYRVQLKTEKNLFEEELALVKGDGGFGFINNKGKQIIPCNYADANIFSEGLVKSSER